MDNRNPNWAYSNNPYSKLVRALIGDFFREAANNLTVRKNHETKSKKQKGLL